MRKPSLKLNREILVSLQEKQMSAILGGEAMWSSGETSGCPSSDCTDSCCKKSCKKAEPEEPVEQIGPMP